MSRFSTLHDQRNIFSSRFHIFCDLALSNYVSNCLALTPFMIVPSKWSVFMTDAVNDGPPFSKGPRQIKEIAPVD